MYKSRGKGMLRNMRNYETWNGRNTEAGLSGHFLQSKGLAEIQGRETSDPGPQKDEVMRGGLHITPWRDGSITPQDSAPGHVWTLLFIYFVGSVAFILFAGFSLSMSPLSSCVFRPITYASRANLSAQTNEISILLV